MNTMKNITRREFGSIMTGAAMVGTASFTDISHAEKQANPPNILFIMTDDLPNNAMSCYGSKVNKTPNLDRIADEGMRFDHAYVTTSLCSPSRASILTGTYPHINGQVLIPRIFDGSQPTFPQFLQKSTYQTALIGKWHLISEPTGFDYWNILIGQGNYFNPTMVENGSLKEYTGYTTDIITDLTIDWLKQRNTEQPFCLLCHHKAPHWVWEPDEKNAQLLEDTTFPLPETFNDTHEGRVSPRESDLSLANMHEHPLYKRWHGQKDVPEGLSPEEIKRRNYTLFLRDVLACSASVDENVGRLLDYLDEAGLADNTIVVYTSDNGYFIGEHGWTDKKVIYEESIRVPLLVRYPCGIERGTVNKDFVLNIDFAPTFLDYAGIECPSIMQGASFRQLLEGKTPANWRDSFYYQMYHANKTIDRRLPHYGIRLQNYKLAHWYREINDWELYDLESDPNELLNVYNDPAYAAVIPSLKDELARLRKSIGITEEMDHDFADKSMNNFWMDEVKAYRKQKMDEWKRGS